MRTNPKLAEYNRKRAELNSQLNILLLDLRITFNRAISNTESRNKFRERLMQFVDSFGELVDSAYYRIPFKKERKKLIDEQLEQMDKESLQATKD